MEIFNIFSEYNAFYESYWDLGTQVQARYRMQSEGLHLAHEK